MPRDATCLVCGKSGDRRYMDVTQRCEKCAAKGYPVPIERRLPEDQPVLVYELPNGGDGSVTDPAEA